MDIEKVKQLRRKLTLHFSILACLTAILVANNGSGNIFLPVLILLVTSSAFVLVDWLEVFYVGQLGSYVAMGLATVLAIGLVVVSTIHGNESTQLLSVAGLLIFPQCVLFFQKKNLRVFEQLAIFLLLQMIVAALINDNIIYGVLLTPILLAWVSSLFLFARYAAIVKLAPEVEDPIPLLYEVIWSKIFKSKSIQHEHKASLVVTEPIVNHSEICSPRRPLTLSSLLGMAALVFAAMMFLCLPRNGYGVSFSSLSNYRTGIPELLNTRIVGRLLSDTSPIFKLKLYQHGITIKPDDPPYLRVDVFDRYEPPVLTRASGNWGRSGAIRRTRLMPKQNYDNRDEVRVEIKVKDAQQKQAKNLASLPPIIDKSAELSYDSSLMIFEQIGPDHPYSTRNNFQYTYKTLGFRNGAFLNIYPNQSANPDSLSKFPVDLPQLRKHIHSVFGNTELLQQHPFEAAKEFEKYFRDSGRFTYTLDVPPQIETDIDPIEDFVLNTRRGFCSHYATAMVSMLRLSKIPCRLVLGYRPTEWHKLGECFQVRNSDSHVWVEVLFSRKELQGTELEPWLTDNDSYWVLFDPTPYSDQVKPLITSQNRPLDYAEEIWDDILFRPASVVVDSPYGTMAKAGQEAIVGQILRLWNLMREWFSGLSFAWQLALGVFALGAIPALLWQLAIGVRRILRLIAGRIGWTSSHTKVQQKFIAKCLRLLESLDLMRAPDETLGEFSQRACNYIESRAPDHEGLRASLSYLTSTYHRLRFGKNESLTSADEELAEQHLIVVAQAVKMAKRNSTTPIPSIS